MKVLPGNILLIFIIWRTFLFLLAWLGQLLLPFAPSFPYSDVLLIPSGLSQWIWPFANFDGVHYLTIAKFGYSAQFTQVFFPLYPLLLKFLMFIFPFLNPIIIGLFISNLFFLLLLFILWKLLKLDYKSKQINWILLFFIFFPTSFFFGSLYTESLFFLLVISSFYASRAKKWWIAAILGTLASATRFVGIFLLPALLWEWNTEFKIKNLKLKIITATPGSRYSGTKQDTKLLKFIKSIFHFPFSILHSPILYLVPLGLLSYIVYLQVVFGDPLYFWHAQPIFGAQRSGEAIILLPQVIWRYFKILATVPNYQYDFWVAVWELSSIIISYLLLIIATVLKVRPSYLIFSFLVVTIPTLTGTLSSMPRYILQAFSIYIVLGMIKSTAIKISLLFFSILLLALFTILFTSGRWVS